MLANVVHAAAAVPETSSPNQDIRILIDISGSMKRTDPNNLRTPALKLLTSLLPHDSHAGVWTFGQWVNMLVKQGPVDGHWKAMAREKAELINSHGLFTNMEDALRRATWDWTRPAPSSKRSLILLTDGLVDISEESEKNAHSRQQIIESILPRLKSAGVTIHTIALSDESDKGLMQQLSALTGGRFEIIKSASGLEKVFLRLFEQVADADTLPLKNNRVTIDESVHEATFLLFRKNESSASSITLPNGSNFSVNDHPTQVQWHRESHYDLITIKNPTPGDWLINGELDPDNRVIIVTDLQLHTTTLPSDILAGTPLVIRAQMEQKGDVVSQPDLLRFVSAKLVQNSMNDKQWQWDLMDDGKGPDKTKGDGIFTAQIEDSLLQGEHEFQINIDGTTFQRNKRQLVKIHQSPVSTQIIPLNENSFALTIIPYENLLDTNSLKLSVQHKAPGHKAVRHEIPRISPAEWRYDFIGQTAPGNHQFEVHLIANKKNGAPLKMALPAMTYEVSKDTADKENTATDDTKSKKDAPENKEESTPQKTNWLMVSLRVMVFNIMLILLAFGAYKLWQPVSKKLFAMPIEA